MTRYRLMIMLLLTAFAPLYAQTLQASAAADSRGRITPTLRLDNLRLAGASVNLSLLGGVSRPLAFGVSARQLTSFGPVGNLTLRSATTFDTAGNFSAGLAASGVIANVAAELELTLTTLNPGDLTPSELFLSDRPVVLADGGFAGILSINGSYRLNRTTILRLETTTLATTGGLAAHLRGHVRLVGLVGRDDLFVLLEGYGDPGFAQGFGALGATYDVNRANWPDITATALIGYGPGGLRPGARLTLSQPLATANGRLNVQLRAEPYRVGSLPYRASLGYEFDLLGGRLRLEGYGTLDNPLGVAPFTGAVSYQLSF